MSGALPLRVPYVFMQCTETTSVNLTQADLFPLGPQRTV